MKPVIVSGLTGSAPLNAKRHDDRSRAFQLVFRNAPQAKLVEEFGPPEIVPRWRWIARSHWLGRARKASGDISTTGKPQYMVAKQPPMIHVVVQRQPAHEHVGRGRPRRLAHRAHIGKQVGVREHDAFRLRCCPRCTAGSRLAGGRLHRDEREDPRRSPPAPSPRAATPPARAAAMRSASPLGSSP